MKSSKKKYKAQKYFLVFYIMSVFGFLVESIWAYYRHREFILKTSMVFELFIPIYGIGALLLILCLNKLKDKNPILLFLSSAVLGGLFEVVCSLFQEFFLGTRSWNYSGKFMPFFEGRTCLKYCVFWGLIGVIWIKWLWPKLNCLIEKINLKVLKKLCIILLIALIFDSVVSILACNRRVDRYYEVEASNKVDELLDKYFDDDYLKKRYTNLKIIEK